MQTISSILALTIREFKITYRNFADLFSIFLFFLLGIIIFIFAVGIDKEIFDKISIGIIWTLILLSNNLSLRKFYQDDFNDGSIILYHMSGLSYELITFLKLIIVWLCLQLPFFLIIPLSGVMLDIEILKIKLICLSFLIGSPIITSIASISGAMNLLNNKNFAIGSLIIMFLSIPVIIFSVSLVNSSEEIFTAQFNILLGIMFFALAVTPWICSTCIKIAIQNK